jgi:hypothetical protein
MSVRRSIKKLLNTIANADGPHADRATLIVERAAAVNSAIELSGGTPVGILATAALLVAFTPPVRPTDFDVLPVLTATVAADVERIHPDDQVSAIVLAALTTARYRPHRADAAGDALRRAADAIGRAPAQLALALHAVRRARDWGCVGEETEVVRALGLELTHPEVCNRVNEVWGSDSCEDELDRVPGDIALDWALALGVSNDSLVGYLAWGAVADAGRSAAGHRLTAALIMAGYVSTNSYSDSNRIEARADVASAVAQHTGSPQPEFEDALWTLAGKITDTLDTLDTVVNLPPIVL